jgi:hypothetical protein
LYTGLTITQNFVTNIKTKATFLHEWYKVIFGENDAFKVLVLKMSSRKKIGRMHL